MNAKEKALELIVNYQLQCKSLDYQQAKQCALIAIENAVENIEAIDSKMINDNFKEAILIYWEAVKNEIERL